MKGNNMLLIQRLQLIIIAVVFLLGSCSKQAIEAITNDEAASLIVSVAGVNPSNDKIKLQAYANQNIIGLGPKSNMRKESAKNGRLTMDIISDQDIIDQDLGQSLGDNGLMKQAVAGTIDGAVKYIFILEKVSGSNSTFSHIRQFSVIEARANLNDLESGAEYRWYAYSYLTDSDMDIPSVEDVSAGNTTVPTFHDNTLVHASGRFKALPQNKISIVFDHKLTQVNVEVNVRRAYADITNIKGKLLNRTATVKTGAFNFISGTTGNYNSAVIDEEYLLFENKIPGDNSVKVAKYYTADPSLTEFNVEISELTVQYPNGVTEVLDDRIPNNGFLEFTGFLSNNSGHMLKGKLNVVFPLPEMTIIAYSNNVDDGNYRLGATTAAGLFVRNHKWFGPGSEYVDIDNVIIDTHNDLNKLKVSLATPANYPEILIIGNDNDYLDATCWGYVMNYLNAGGIVYHAQDNDGGTANRNFLRTLLGSESITLNRPGENRGVYLFTNTDEAKADTEILNGVFGDVSPYHWGQDRVGTTYVRGYTGNDVIVYSNHAENKNPPSVPGMAFFRHKTKKYFYVGDGGFFANRYSGLNNNSTTAWPFRTNATGPDQDFPLNALYGDGATSNAPTKGAAGSYEIANGKMFGNMLAWMLEQAYFYPVNRN